MRISTRGAVAALFSAVLWSGTAAAVTFETDFENQNTGDQAVTFRIQDGSLFVDFAGGTARTVGVGSLYRSGDVSWMLEPSGVNQSSGTATATLSDGASELELYAIREASVTSARIQFMAGATVVREDDIGTGFQQHLISVTAGNPEIDQVIITHDGGTGMVAIEDFRFDTDPGGFAGGGGGSDGNALGAWALLLLALASAAAVMRRGR